MDIKPNIRKGFGPMTTRGWNKIANKANERSPANDARARKSSNGNMATYVGIITGRTTLIASRRFLYKVKQAVCAPTTYIFSAAANADENDALNTVESLQQASGTKNGPGVTHTNIPAGFTFEAIQTGTCVIVTQIDGKHYFTVSTAIDGGCPA